MNIPAGAPQLFGAACFTFGSLMLLNNRKTLGYFRLLLLPFSISSIAFFLYFLRNVIVTAPALRYLGSAFSFLMWGSWLTAVILILKRVERRESV